MITITAQELQELVNYINTIPTGYGYSLIKFIEQKQNKEIEAEQMRAEQMQKNETSEHEQILEKEN